MKYRTIFITNTTNGGDIVHGANLIVSMHKRYHRLGVFFQQFFQLIVVDVALGIQLQLVHLYFAFGFQLFGCLYYGLVLNFCGEQVLEIKCLYTAS